MSISNSLKHSPFKIIHLQLSELNDYISWNQRRYPTNRTWINLNSFEHGQLENDTSKDKKGYRHPRSQRWPDRSNFYSWQRKIILSSELPVWFKICLYIDHWIEMTPALVLRIFPSVPSTKVNLTVEVTVAVAITLAPTSTVSAVITLPFRHFFWSIRNPSGYEDLIIHLLNSLFKRNHTPKPHAVWYRCE
jgi:hypothetical protein